MRTGPLVALLLFLSAVASLAQTGPSAATWRQALGARAFATPAPQAGSVVLVCDDGSLRSYASSGKELWRWDSLKKLLPVLTRSREGTNYAVIAGGTLVAVNRAGRELWRRAIADTTGVRLATGWDGRIFVAVDDALLCFTEAGFRLWKRPLSARPATAPALDASGGVVLALADGTLLRATPFGELSATPLPRVPIAVAPLFGAAVFDEVAVSNAVAVAFGDGTIVAYSPAGRERPMATLRSGAKEIRGRDRFLAYALADGEVGLLDTDGALLWTGTVPLADGGALHLDERGVYYLSKRGSAGFSYDGRRLWTIGIEGASTSAALADEGLLYSGGEDWILYAYRMEERVKSEVAPRYGIDPPGNYALAANAAAFAGDDLFPLSESTVAQRLDSIQRSLEKSEVGGEEPAFTGELMAIAGKPQSSRNRRFDDEPAIPPHLRERAVVLLSRFASRESVPFLVELFNRDAEVYVRAAAAEAIGRIGIDPGARALSSFASAVFPPVPIRDERLLTAVATATGSLCRFSGPPLSDAGVAILIALASDDRPPRVRERARAELALLASP